MAYSTPERDAAVEHPKLTERQVLMISPALAEPRRYQILKTLSAAKSATPIATLLQTHRITAATFSHHIKELDRADIIDIERHGKSASVALRRGVLRLYIQHLKDLTQGDF